jgi:hypothetical protein
MLETKFRDRVPVDKEQANLFPGIDPHHVLTPSELMEDVYLTFPGNSLNTG